MKSLFLKFLIVLGGISFVMMSTPANCSSDIGVGVGYNGSSGQPISASTSTAINFITLVFDTNESVSSPTSNWTFTVPSTGRYLVNAGLIFSSGNWAAGDFFSLSVVRNGSDESYLDRKVVESTIASDAVVLSGSDLKYFSSGDTIQIKTFASTSNSKSIYDCFVSINRTGD